MSLEIKRKRRNSRVAFRKAGTFAYVIGNVISPIPRSRRLMSSLDRKIPMDEDEGAAEVVQGRK